MSVATQSLFAVLKATVGPWAVPIKSSMTAIKSLMLVSVVAGTLAWPSYSALAETAVGTTAAPVASPKPEGKTSAEAPAAAQATSVSPDKPGDKSTDKPSAQASASPSDKPTDKSNAPGEPPVLDPNKFFGHAKSGYAAAQLCPEICAKLFCYCGCDMTDDHDSLLDCFTTDHGVDCHICQEEALIALKMKREGKTMKQIQQAIDIMFEKEYPFDEPSAVIQKYRKNRLWQPGTVKTLGKAGSAAGTNSAKAGQASGNSTQSASGKAAPASGKTASNSSGKPLLGKNGQPVGACCAGHSKEKK